MSPVSRKTAHFVIATSILIPISTAAIGLRILASRKRKQCFKLHDYLAFFCFASQIGHFIDVAIGVARGGYGVHMTALSLEKIVLTLKVFWVSEWFWATSVTSFRLSILILYAGIFKTHRFHKVVIATAVVVFLYFVACVFTISLLCRPVQFNWDRSIAGTCGNVKAIEVFSGAFNMLVDLWVVFLPLPVIWKLQMTLQKKWGITASFALGLITAAINLGRLVQTFKCSPDADFSYCAMDSSVLVLGEMTGGILLACVPTFGPLLFPDRKNNSEDRNNNAEIPTTIGSKPTRRKKVLGSVLVDSLFSSNAETECQEEELEDALPMRGADMGYRSQHAASRDSDGQPWSGPAIT